MKFIFKINRMSLNILNTIKGLHKPVYCVPELPIFIGQLLEKYTDFDDILFPIDKRNAMFLTNKTIIKKILKIFYIQKLSYIKSFIPNDNYTYEYININNTLFSFFSETAKSNKLFLLDDITDDIKPSQLYLYVNYYTYSNYSYDEAVFVSHMNTLNNYLNKLNELEIILFKLMPLITEEEYKSRYSDWLRVKLHLQCLQLSKEKKDNFQ